ncbi:hypothetical protein [Winogradskyella pulchriflava]|uniref:Lipid/polyisoprenoid-binding YceI-like domain-containing protein n=1 Tax=Winogradskyella pulchriflava TaxID=1110688 RepID=A0ABV6QC89_9FLAO
MIRILLSAILLLGFTHALFVEEEFNSKEVKVFLSPDSYLKINGKTNVSTFQCQFDIATFSKGVSLMYKDYDSIIKFDAAKLTLPNLKFDCGGKAINKDFNKLLNTDEHPEIILNLREISKQLNDKNTVNAIIEITICDIIKTYTIPVSVANEGGICVSGLLPININDFNLTAPTKMLGIVKVYPEIEIDFLLQISKP